jgi:hypothetical protein
VGRTVPAGRSAWPIDIAAQKDDCIDDLALPLAALEPVDLKAPALDAEHSVGWHHIDPVRLDLL